MATGPWGGILDSRVFRVKISWTQAGQQCQTGYHIRDVGVNTLTPEDVAEEAAELAQTNAFRTLFATVDQIVSVDAVNLRTAEGHTIALPNVMGLQNAEALPSFTACSLALVGGIRKRYANGRMFWPVRGENTTTADILNATGVGIFDAAIAEFTSRYMGGALFGTQQLVHLHEAKPARPAVGKPEPLPAVPATWYDITAIKLNRAVTALTSRKVGVGS